MSKELNKQVEYKGHKINIKIDLDYQGKSMKNLAPYYEVIVNDMGNGNYYIKYHVKPDELEEELSRIEEITKEHFDGLINSSKSETEILLEKLGYK